MTSPLSIVMLGATGAVGTEVVRTLLTLPQVGRLTLLGRRPLEGVHDPRVSQQLADISDPASYRVHLGAHAVAICTLGIGEPSKVTREEFVRVDKTAVFEFGTACKAAGVEHFLLLSSVGADSSSRAFYLRTKGELEDALRGLCFAHLSLFHPSMILTPANRYGVMQGLMLASWPLLGPLLVGPLRRYRGVRVEALGAAIAIAAVAPGSGTRVLEWDDIRGLAPGSPDVRASGWK